MAFCFGVVKVTTHEKYLSIKSNDLDPYCIFILWFLMRVRCQYFYRHLWYFENNIKVANMLNMLNNQLLLSMTAKFSCFQKFNEY